MTIGRQVSILAFAILAVRGDDPLAQATQHPNPRYVDQTLQPTAHIRLAGPRSTMPFTFEPSPLATIGAESGPDELTFGQIVAVGIVGDTLLAILDGKMSEVRLFAIGGRFLGRLGRAGQGPGEFRTPVALAVSAENELWVADLGRTIQVFRPTPSGYRYSRTLTLPVGVRSMCFLGPQLFVNGLSPTDSTVIRAVDTDGTIRRSFGVLYKSPNSMINYEFGAGRLDCDRTTGLIIFAPASAFGEVRAYRPDGTLVWRTVVDGFLANIIEDMPSGYSVRLSPDGINTLQGLVSIPGAGLVVQWGYATQQELREGTLYGTLITALVNPTTGQPGLITGPQLRIGSATADLLVLVEEDPAPRVVVHRLRRRQ